MEEIKEEILCGIGQHDTFYTQRDEIFNAFNSYVIKNSLERKNCIGLYIDGAASTVGRHYGVTKRIQPNGFRLFYHLLI